MTFEEIESAWALQRPPQPGSLDLSALKRALRSQLKRRQRLLILGGASLIFTLVFMQVLFFLNLRAIRVEEQWLSFARLMLHQALNLVIVLEVVRIFLRHRRLARGRANTVLDVVQLSLAGVEAEMADYRLGWWVAVVLAAHSTLSAYLNHPVGGEGWDAFGVRAGLIVAVYGLIGVMAWRQYRRKLLPERDRLHAILDQLAGSSG